MLRCKTFCSRSLIPQDFFSHINVSMVSFLQSLLLLFHFCVFLSRLSELVWKLAKEISLQSTSKRFPSFGSPANSNKSNDKKIPISPKPKLNGNNKSLICNPEKFQYSIELGQAQCKRIFQGSLTLLASFDFATSCPKIKVWCMRSVQDIFF